MSPESRTTAQTSIRHFSGQPRVWRYCEYFFWLVAAASAVAVLAFIPSTAREITAGALRADANQTDGMIQFWEVQNLVWAVLVLLTALTGAFISKGMRRRQRSRATRSSTS